MDKPKNLMESNYIEPFGLNMGARRCGSRTLIGMLIREYGLERIQEDFAILERQVAHVEAGGKFYND
jgi:hypothetical protein